MSEGPQVKLRAEWLHEQLAGRVVRRSRAGREKLADLAADLPGRVVMLVFCKGKHIFLEFAGGLILHNHLLMRGSWRATRDPLLLLPTSVWLTIETDYSTVANHNGQVLEAVSPARAEEILASLGLDICADPFEPDAFAEALAGDGRPIGEVLLDQSIWSGMGNVAKSEALYLAGIDPRTPASLLGWARREQLARSSWFVCEESLKRRGRWSHRVYRRAGQRCDQCGGRIQRIAQAGRGTYFCPACQAG